MTSEPTTGENNDWISTEIIVRMLRKIQNSAQVVLDSGFGTRDGECNMVYRDQRDNMNLAADRLESQEQAIEELKSEAIVNALENAERIANLTARAEQAEKNCDIWEKKWWEEALKKVEVQAFKEKAERERDAVIADLDALKDCGFCNSCVGCNAPHSEEITYCTDWTRRGLPQEGVKE